MTATTSTESKREKILAAAAELFYEQSFAAVGMDAIGQKAGLTGPAIYRYFSGKDEILATLFDEALDGLLAATGNAYEDPWEELDYLVRGHTRFVIEQRRLAGVKVREERSLSGPTQQRLRARERRYVGRWLDCVAACAPDLPPDAQISAGHAAVELANSVALWPTSVLKYPDVPAQLATIVVGGLRAVIAADRA